MEMFGVDGLFTPRDPVCSAKGAVVTNIAHIPAALTQVMALNGIEPDFAPKGDLSLKAWFGNNQGLALPPELDLPVVEAPPPYDAQIRELRRQVGAVFIRQSMKDTSGATVMDPATQVTSLHGVSMLDAARGAVRGQPVPRRPARAERPQRRQAGQRRDRGPRQPARRPDPGRRRRRPRRPATRPTPCSPRPPASSARAGSRAPGARPRRCSSCSWTRSRTPLDERSSFAGIAGRAVAGRRRTRPQGGGPAGGARGARAARCSCATCARSGRAASPPTRCWPPSR